MNQPLGTNANWTVFDPRAYLDQYYGDVGAENQSLIRFMTQSCAAGSSDIAIEIGGGPTVYTILSLCNKVSELHFCDYLESNLEEVRKWLNRDSEAFDWTAFTREILRCEGITACSAEEVFAREEAARKCVTKVFRVDAGRPHALDGSEGRYRTVVSNFCAESCTDSRATWGSVLRNIAAYVAPGGQLMTAALKGATSYSVGGRQFPALNIREVDLSNELEAIGFERETIKIAGVAADRPGRGYEGLMFASATRR